MPEYEEHPTQKPVALFERIIKASSNPGDLVLDPFVGTFTTCFVAKELGRRSIGIEIEEHYVKTGLRRLNVATHFNGELLVKPLKSYESGYAEQEMTPMIAGQIKWSTLLHKPSGLCSIVISAQKRVEIRKTTAGF